MTPMAIIKEAKEAGVSLALSHRGTIKASGEQAVLNRWLPLIRENKGTIIEALSEAAREATSWGWHIYFTDGKTVETYVVPVSSCTEVLALFPGAVEAVPIRTEL